MTATVEGTHDEVTVGVDLGGTGTRVVAMRRDGRVIAEDITATPTNESPQQAVDGLVEQIRTTARDIAITAVGIGASGPVDSSGVIRNHDTLSAYSDIPIGRLVAEQLAVPCLVDNDAAAAALGEHAHGAGRGCAELLVVTLGTGVGVALLRDGRPFRTAQGLHPEGGHVGVPGPSAPCYCGLPTCWEQLASRTALSRMTTRPLDVEADEARAGNEGSLRLFEQYGQHVAAGLSTHLTLFQPDRVVLAGGVLPYFDLFEPAMLRALERPGWYGAVASVVPATLGPHCGAIGAAVMAARQ